MISLALILIYCGALVWWGSRSRPSFASWHMFASLKRVDLHLRAESSPDKDLNPWLYLPHTHLSMSAGEAKEFIQFLEQIHRTKVTGHVVVRDEHHVRRLLARPSRDVAIYRG